MILCHRVSVLVLLLCHVPNQIQMAPKEAQANQKKISFRVVRPDKTDKKGRTRGRQLN